MTALTSIFYEGYRIPLSGDSLSTVAFSGGDYDTIHIGSLPIEAYVADGDTYLVTINEAQAE